MTFEEAGSRYAQLRAQLQSGQMDYADFQAEAAKLAVIDPNGNWWQIDPAGGEWLMWDGAAWVRPGAPQAAAPSPAPRRQYSLLLQTQDYRTQLQADGEDALWVYGSLTCDDPAVDCAALAGSIQFQAGGANPRWLVLSQPAPIGGTMAVRITCLPPDPAAQPAAGGASVVATAAVEGGTVSAETVLEILAAAPAAGAQHELAPLVWGFRDNARQPCRKRLYKGLELGEFEVVADGEDQLGVAVIFARSDLIQEGVEPASYAGVAADFVRIRRAELTGEGAAEFELNLAPAVSGLQEIRIRSRRPLVAGAATAGISLALVVEGEAPEAAASQSPRRELLAHVPLQHRLLFLKTIVVPGAAPGTSEAWAYVGAAAAVPAPMRDVACRIDLVSLGGVPQIVVRGDAVRRTREDGLANWTFDYRGLDWNNLAQARFKVRIGVAGASGLPSEATWVEIDAADNHRRFLADLAAAAGQLDLNNPAFGPRGDIFDQMWPAALRGPLNDVCGRVDATGNWRRYTGREIRDRIWRFALARRFAADAAAAAAMNGLDFGQFPSGPAHSCCGLLPAGNDDPHLIDPWWEQAFFPDRVTLTRPAATARVNACAALLPAIGAAVMLRMGVGTAVSANLAAIREWLAGGAAPAAEPWLGEGGAYREAPPRWGESFFQGAGSEAMKTGMVSPLESW